MRTIIVSGLSGSGKSVALHTLEDEGFYCVDNLPGSMLPDLIDTIQTDTERQIDNMAVGIDARSLLTSVDNFLESVAKLKDMPAHSIEILFLETRREVLIQRFSETRRKHPLSFDNLPLVTAIDRESELLAHMQADADLVIDTSTLNLHQLRQTIRDQLIDGRIAGPALMFQSFGFKHGIPMSTDILFDVRCLPNPYWKPMLRDKTGKDQEVEEFLGQHDSVAQMIADIKGYVERWLPSFRNNNRAYLTVSIGCTGGKHRSVFVAEALKQAFDDQDYDTSVRHRDIEH